MQPPIHTFAKCVLFSSALFTIEIHSELSPSSAGVHRTRFSMSQNTLYICCTREAASDYLFVMSWYYDFSDASFIFSISGTSVLGRPPFWCALRFTSCLIIYYSTEDTRGRAANFTDTTFSKREFDVKTLRKTKSVKTTLFNTRFLFILLNPTENTASNYSSSVAWVYLLRRSRDLFAVENIFKRALA
jgi:hypothetical protein